MPLEIPTAVVHNGNITGQQLSPQQTSIFNVPQIGYNGSAGNTRRAYYLGDTMRFITALLAALLFSPIAFADGLVLSVGGGWAQVDDTGFERRESTNLYIFENWVQDFDGGSSDGYVIDGVAAHEWSDVKGGALRAGVYVARFGGFDTDVNNSFNQTVDYYKAEKTLTLASNFSGDMQSTSAGLEFTYVVNQISTDVMGVTIAPFIKARVGGSKNEFEDGKYTLNGKLKIDYGEGMQELSGGASCKLEDKNNFDLAGQAGGGVELGFTQNIALQLEAAWFTNGIMESPERANCTGSIEGQTVKFTQDLAKAEQELTGVRAGATLMWRFGTGP